MKRIESSAEWAQRITDSLPPRWRRRVLDRWIARGHAHAPGDPFGHIHSERAANIELRQIVGRLDVVRLPLDASDSEICRAADALAGRATEFGRVYRAPNLLRAAMGRMATGHGIEPPAGEDDAPAVARMSDPQWWRRQLRKVHAEQVEGAAIALGYVHRRADPYVSQESVVRRAGQNERNAASLEATIATNEDGQEYTLAELAAKGPANKAIRRAELMTRISGFERIADDLGHVGIFFTLTCPSRMHKWRTVGNGQVKENPRYDGTLPNESQRYHGRVWARIRAKLKRAGIGLYGFRIAEPNHDGTPHWHCLMFVSPQHVDELRAIVLHYALADSGDERGALEHRVDWKPIDKGRGSASGYIAKYVAKNIDGYRLDKDLIGNDAVETSHRVEAWASTWRIRQFQQIGGPPVGVWRELRRVKEVPANAPANLIEAHQAVNKTKAIDDLSDSQQQAVKGAQWDKYVMAQGGPTCGRAYAIRVEVAEREGVNKYGEALAPVPVGVSTMERYQPDHMTPERMGGAGLWAMRRVIVESARHVWTIAKKAARAIVRVFGGTAAQTLAPWTCVNNCTATGRENEDEKWQQPKKTSAQPTCAPWPVKSGAHCTTERPLPQVSS